MFSIPKPVIEFLATIAKKSPAYVALLLAMISGLALWTPEVFPARMHVAELIARYPTATTLTMVGSLVTFGALFLAGLHEFIRREITGLQRIRSLHKGLNYLAGDEKEILKQFVAKDCRSIRFNRTNGTVKALIAVKILYDAPGVGDYASMDACIQQWALDYLKKNPKLLT